MNNHKDIQIQWLRWASLISIVGLLVLTYSNCGDAVDPSSLLNASDTRTCFPRGGASGSPQTIEEAVALINSLPKPTTVACYVEALDRPLRIYATNSTASAQPAGGEGNPRLFILTGSLITSVVPAGTSKDMMEFGLVKSTGLSLKGEVKFPITENLVPSAPYDRIRQGGGTLCNACHGSETQDPNIDFATAFISVAVRPFEPFREPISELRTEQENCNSNVEPERCQMLNAIFNHGEVIDQRFPSSVPD